MKKQGKEKKQKTVYLEDNGETIYSMAALSGMTPEELDELNEKKKNRVNATAKERWAMILAAAQVYLPLLLIVIFAFGGAALFMYFFLK
ncbi:MAG: hypothetical protein IJY23_02515 [Clostridia bacterium]|nr:hypothetical protein [Clostridia bacterium]